MYRLKELVLQNVGLNGKDMKNIADFCMTVQSLKKLNISSNGLTMPDFTVLFDLLKPQAYTFSHLNMSWNTLPDAGST